MPSCFRGFCVCLTLLLLQQTLLPAQDRPAIDSLLQRLKVSEGKTRLEVLNALADKYCTGFYIDSTLTVTYAQQMYTLAAQMKDVHFTAYSLYYLGEADARMGHKLSGQKQFKAALNLCNTTHEQACAGLAWLGLAEIEADKNKALPLYKKALDMAGKDPFVTLRVLFYLSRAYELFGNYTEALNCARQSFETAIAQHNRGWIAQTENILGLVYHDIGRPDEAETYFLGSLRLAEAIQDENGQAIFLNNLSDNYRIIRNYPQALKYGLLAVEKSKKANNKPDLGYALATTGEVYLALNQFTDAEISLQKSLSIARDVKDQDLEVDLLTDLAQLYLRTQRTNLALNNARASVQLARILANNEAIRNAAKLQAQAASTLGLYPEAYTAVEISLAADSSLMLEEINKQLTAQKNEAEFAKQKLEMGLEEERMQAHTRQRNGLLIVVAVIIIAGIFQVRAYILQRRANKLLAVKQEQIKIQNEEISSVNEKLSELNQLLEERSLRVIESINYASRIQEAILPDIELIKKQLPNHFILYKPKDIVSGDFYWFSGKYDKLVLAAVDCTGHGVPGAFMSMIGNTLLNQIVNESAILDPGQILTEMHRSIRSVLRQQDGSNREGMDIALVVIDTILESVAYAGANNSLYYTTPEGVFEIKADKQGIGGLDYEEARTFNTHVVKAAANMKFYLLSDGFQDQFGGTNGRKFGISALKELLKNMQGSPLTIQKDELENSFTKWRGKKVQVDDILVIGFSL